MQSWIASSRSRRRGRAKLPKRIGITRQTRNWKGPWKRTPGRLFGTGLVRFYQLTLSGFVGNHCRHFPTCSEYAYEAVARYGLWAGGWMGLFRVMRCGPGGTHGLDPVPATLSDRHRWWLPWRYWKPVPKDDH